MKITELRVGNWVYDTNSKTKREIKNILTTDLDANVTEEIDAMEPIPLTEEWLNEFGFRKDKGCEIDYITNVFYSKSIIKGTENHQERISINLPFNSCEIGDLSKEDDMYVFNVDVNNVHQLQNLYFSLTNEELKIK